MKTKKDVAIFSVLLAAALFITGCSSKENEQEGSTSTLSNTVADSGSAIDIEQKEKLLVGSWSTSYSKVTLFTLNSDHTVTVDYTGGRSSVLWELIEGVTDYSEETVYWKVLDDGSLKIYLESDPNKCKICDTSSAFLGEIVAPHDGDNWTLLKEK